MNFVYKPDCQTTVYVVLQRCFPQELQNEDRGQMSQGHLLLTVYLDLENFHSSGKNLRSNLYQLKKNNSNKQTNKQLQQQPQRGHGEGSICPTTPILHIILF